MKKFIKYILPSLVAVVMLMSGCDGTRETANLEKAEDVKAYLIEGNEMYVQSGKNTADISADRRSDTAKNGQHPYAVIVTCSDSRVPPEHIFSAGVGDLFVIRTAGNVIGEYELGSVEYGAEHLGSPLVVVLGHTGCGAVAAALEGGAHGNIKSITDEINSCLTDGCSASEAERLNVQNSIDNIMDSEIMKELTEEGKVSVVGAIYDIESGEVSFIE